MAEAEKAEVYGAHGFSGRNETTDEKEWLVAENN
jgi:hypothetical protein